MRKNTRFRILTLITLLIFLGSSLTVFAQGEDPPESRERAPQTAEQPEPSPDKLVFTITLPEYTSWQVDGYDNFDLEGFSPSGAEGDPLLPRRVYNFALPPDVKFNSLSMEVLDVQTEKLLGTYNIRPLVILPAFEENGLLTRNYQVDEPEPHSFVTMLPPGQMRKWNFAKVEFLPFDYDPATKEITAATQVKIQINYDLKTKPVSSALLADAVMDDVAQDLFENYGTARTWYLTGEPQPSLVYQKIVVITTNAIENNSTKLAAYLTHKGNLGFTTMVITEDEYGGLTGQLPNGTAEKIRKWLIDNYISEQIGYVLLIGNPDPDDPSSGVDSVGDVPMKMMWPRRGAVTDPTYDESPSDYFYADLTGDWDYDNDQYFGEWDGDYNGVSGGVDLSAELYVGRIPVYDAAYSTLDDILQKIIDYETEVSTTWRDNALLPMSYSDALTDGANLSEQMMDDYLNSAGYTSYTQYQQGSACTAANSPYTSDEELHGSTTVKNRWAANDYGLVVWWGHGSATSASIGYGGCSGGTLMLNTYAPDLDDNHPSFVYLNSCSNGTPENAGNLGYALLKNGAIGTVSASRVSWYYVGQAYGTFDGSQSNAGMGYEYAERLADFGQPAGEALYNMKGSLTPSGDWFLMNHTDFNLYGDPTTSLTASGSAPSGVVINEVDIGANDRVELYNPGGSSVDLTGWELTALYDGMAPVILTLPSFTLPAGGYVILDSAAGTNTATHLYFDTYIDWGHIYNDGAQLENGGGIVVDFLKWGGSPVPVPPSSWTSPDPPVPYSDSGPQLGRAPNGYDTDNGHDWCLQNLSMGSQNSGCIHTPANFDNDWDTDISIFRPSTGYWYSSGNAPVWWGASTDWPVPADYNGDGRTEEAVWRPSNGYWYIKDNDSYAYDIDWWGFAGDIPLPADYDGDGLDEIAVYRPSNGTWYELGGPTTIWGVSTDVPLPCDYDGDGATDIAVWRPSTGYWLIEGMTPFWWGAPTDIPVPGDYDGDGDCDAAIWRPSNGYWYVKHDGAYTYDIEWWGVSTDIPVPADYDGDGVTDFAVLRPSTGFWYVLNPVITEWYYSPGDFVLPIRDSNGDGDPWH